MKTGAQKPSKRSLASKENGRKGGLATAKKLSPEQMHERAVKGGQTLVNMYSTDYYRHINGQRRVRKGWPPGKLRKALSRVQEKLQEEIKNGLRPDAGKIFQDMLNTI